MHLTKPTGIKYFVETLNEGKHILNLFDTTNIFNDRPYKLTSGIFETGPTNQGPGKDLPSKLYIAGEGFAYVLGSEYFPNCPVTIIP